MYRKSPGYLLDTHILYWMDQSPDRLSAVARALLGEADESIYCSAASLWELAIKQSLGKLNIGPKLTTLIRTYQVLELPVTAAHAEAAADLPLHHRDPFDRMLIAQAKVEGLILMTTDQRLHSYDVAILRC